MVTGAAGAVGSAVGQIAKLRGCRVVGEYYVLAETSTCIHQRNM